MLAGHEWLTESFSVADILMADVLRLVDRFDGLADFHLRRVCFGQKTRPADCRSDHEVHREILSYTFCDPSRIT